VLAEPVVANVDANKLERIIENLLANAVKHTAAGTRIEVRLERRGDDLLLGVDDRGTGVPDELKAGVFELFNRGSKMLTSETGAGIGLALVARFAALHDGRAWVEDGREGGSSFRVLLPDCVVAEEPARSLTP
jgi:two-component system OmpR family sensor kinase